METTRIAALRETVRERVLETSLRAVARQVAVAPSVLRRFIDGSEPYSATLRRLRDWHATEVALVEAGKTTPLPAGAQTAFTAAEAACLSGLSAKLINRLIDGGEIASLARGGAGARQVGFAELVYLALRKDTIGVLTPAARRRLYAGIKSGVSADAAAAPPLQIGCLRIPLTPAATEVRGRMRALEAARGLVRVSQAVRAGEPVVRGTRVSVYRLAELAQRGVPREEILEDHPAVDGEALDAALLYARAYPRRGRPRRAPWHGRHAPHRDPSPRAE
ncbi:MAG TPA: DUF433 domain-containing protein [Longimicrobium sp.]|nr:DUF433 domain-containing protein [Longimicrobium sp.]